MRPIRLGDRIESGRPPDLDKPYWTADSLAKRVFNTDVGQKELVDVYIQSQPIAARAGLVDDLPAGTPPLGEFETQIVGKLLSPVLPVLCIVGPMGCGKSTTIRYVEHLVRNRAHCCETCAACQERLIAYVDFNEHVSLAESAKDRLPQRLFSVLCDELLARLRLHRQFTRPEEFTRFWEYEFERYRAGEQPSKAFRKIIASWEGIHPVDFSAPSEEDMLKQEQALAFVEQDKELHLDYLVRLWEYMIRVYFGGNHGCAFIILDNIDRIAPKFQRRLVEFVHANARLPGPMFVLLVRPETFDYSGVGTGVIDAPDHRGPAPQDVVLARLQRFCANPESFFDPQDGLSVEQFELLRAFLIRVQYLIRSGPYQTFNRFLEHACGSSIRAGLRMAQNLFRVSLADMQDPNLSIHDVIRTCVNGGEPQLRWTNQRVIEHLFRVSGDEGGSLLVKSRILRYLGIHGQGRRRLREIYNVMRVFGYDESPVREAINDMMRIDSQLVRSNGSDRYYEGDAIQDFGAHRIVLTKIGRGYGDHLISDVDYVQEVMLDTFVDGDHFPRRIINYGYLSEKFRLLHRFLDELRRIDCEEMEHFCEALGAEAYFNAFGEHMISLDIIQGIYRSVVRILTSASSRGSQSARREYEDLIEQFQSLALQVEADNHRLLGLWADSVVEGTDDLPAAEEGRE